MITVTQIMRRAVVLVLFGLMPISTTLRAQVGNGNPTGPAGFFNGNTNTGCSYDPLTGNATRSITDLVVAGSVGTYPLAFSRTANSRYQQDENFGFGQAGSWRHSYAWEIDGAEESNSNFAPTQYPVYFPDGRVVYFTASSSDIYFRGPPGVRERFKPLDGSLRAYLIMADGGKVEFKATRSMVCDNELNTCTYSYSYRAQAIIDPYGLSTTLSYYADGSLNTVREPGGRWLQLTYVTPSPSQVRVIDHVQASDGRVVQYTYGQASYPPGTLAYTYLGNVVYPFEPALNLSPMASYAYQAPNGRNPNGSPLLAACDDPMYAGPMKKISYAYATSNADFSNVAVGQILSENNANTGQIVSRLNIVTSTRHSETRGDGPSRFFVYDAALLKWFSDFIPNPTVLVSQSYDANSYVHAVTDLRGNTTNFTNNPLTGAVTQIQYPLTPNDTPPGTPRGTVVYTYGGGTNCLDPNNQDPNIPYYLCSVTDEAGNITRLTRDSNKRVTRIDYPDTAFETFTYDSSTGQVLSHRMKTEGMETYTYDSVTHLRQTYRNPDNASGNPTARYQYDALGRVAGATDVLGFAPGDVNHTTNYTYNSRGQLLVTTFPTDPIDNLRHAVQNSYNPNGDGTLVSSTNQLGHTTSYTYDDYRRPRSVTTPPRFSGDNAVRTAYFSYDRNQEPGDDYTHTDSNVTRLTLPSGKMVKTIYDGNYRKRSVTPSATYGSESATTSYGYDKVGNLTSVLTPDQQPGQINAGRSTVSAYDERNRPMSVTDALNHPTSFTYDQGGRKKTVTQPNGQIITYDIYDVMNRVLQQTAKQTPSPDAVTKYTYEPSGLHMTMQDPGLVARNSAYQYTFEYDQMGRKKSVTYPPATNGGAATTEVLTYDPSGRLSTFANRSGNTQTFSYDALNRQTGFNWNDSGPTPPVAFGYDVAGRMRSIINANATIVREYFNDNLLKSETETAAGQSPNAVFYDYDVDGQRGNIIYPSGRNYSYSYTGRNDLWYVKDNASGIYQVSYRYGENGNVNLTKRYAGNSGVVTDLSQRDGLNRVTHLEHRLAGTTRTLDYGYDVMGNITSVGRDGGTPDSYQYDLARQLTGTALGNATTDFTFDANGNRTYGTWGAVPSPCDDPPCSPIDTDPLAGPYEVNNLNQYTKAPPAIFGGSNITVTHDQKGNLSSFGSRSYVYDAQNRLTKVMEGTTTLAQYWYDGLNRQITRNVNGAITYHVWDGWNLIEERGPGNALQNAYLYGAGEIVENVTTQQFYFQEVSGSTSHLSDAAGNLLEEYTYSGFGQPNFYNAAGGGINGSNYGVRHLFQGELWTQQTGLNDHRNRQALPALGVFLQPDPIGFAGDPTNLYRYCGGDPMNRKDPFGLTDDNYNWKLGHTYSSINGFVGQGLSTQGWWSTPGGFPTGLGSGSSGGDSNQGGGSGGARSGGSYGYITMTTLPVIVAADGITPLGSFFNPANTNPGDDNFGFRPGAISTGRDNRWNEFYRWLNKPATAEQAAFTDRGRVPTLVVTGILALPFVAPETGLYAATAAAGSAATAWAATVNAVENVMLTAIAAGYVGYQGLMANPQYMVGAQQFAQGFTPGMGGATASWYGFAGWWTGTFWRDYEKHH